MNEKDIEHTDGTDQPMATAAGINPAFIRTWYKDKATCSDEEIYQFWTDDEEASNHPSNFAELLAEHNLSLKDVPKNVDWNSYSRQRPTLTNGHTSEYHIIFHYLKEQRRIQNFDISFYRAYYEITDNRTDNDVFNEWRDDGEVNKNHSSFSELLAHNGLDKLSSLIGRPISILNYDWDWAKKTSWEDLLIELKMYPVRMLKLTTCEETNRKIYDALCQTFDKMGLHKKSEKIRSLAVELALSPENSTEPNFRSQSITKSKVTKIDPHFYLTWYEDLTSEDKFYLEEHWYNFGFEEGRHPTLEHALQSMDLDIDRLPYNFNHRDYLLHLNESDSKVSLNFYSAIVHKLQNTNDRFHFDTSFYTTFYEDVTHLANLPWQAEMHWLSMKHIDKRFGCMEELLSSLDLQESVLPSWFKINEVRSLNPQLEGSNTDIIVTMLKMEPVIALKVSASNQHNSEFYFNIAHHHERAGRRGQAEELYTIAVNFHDNSLALEHLGNIYLNCGLYKRAGQFYSRALSSTTCSEWAFINKIKSSQQTNDVSDISDTFRSAINRFPDSPRLEGTAKETIANIWSAATKAANYLIKTNNRQKLTETVEAATQSIYDINAIQVKLGKLQNYAGPISNRKVLIIGDFHLPQCKRYRIDQKLEQLGAAGFVANSVSWTDVAKANREIAFSDICIFYRCPALPDIVALISTANTLGKITAYEIDDLIFDPIYPDEFSTYGGYVSNHEYDDLVKGMALYRAAAKLCNYGIASTQPLSNELAKLVRTKKCFVHRNALDKHSTGAMPNRSREKKHVDIFYGSGTKAHNSDFITEALPAILKILEEEPTVRLTVVGYLQLPSAVSSKFSRQIVSAPLINSIQGYSTYLSNADINIAVLKPDKINNTKSELKWFEAALFGIPSVLSNTQNYVDVIEDGIDGFLASNEQDWYRILKNLIVNPKTRLDAGEKARLRVLDEYSLEQMSIRITSIIDLMIKDHEHIRCNAIQKGQNS
jgi:tetratricopeptide (TPR) repeat protein